MNILIWIKGIAIGVGVGLIIGGIGGYKICSSGMWKAVAKDQAKQSEGVSKLHQGELKSAIKTVKVIQYIKSAPDTTGCGKVNMRKIDIEAQK